MRDHSWKPGGGGCRTRTWLLNGQVMTLVIWLYKLDDISRLERNMHLLFIFLDESYFLGLICKLRKSIIPILERNYFTDWLFISYLSHFFLFLCKENFIFSGKYYAYGQWSNFRIRIDLTLKKIHLINQENIWRSTDTWCCVSYKEVRDMVPAFH